MWHSLCEAMERRRGSSGAEKRKRKRRSESGEAEALESVNREFHHCRRDDEDFEVKSGTIVKWHRDLVRGDAAGTREKGLPRVLLAVPGESELGLQPLVHDNGELQ